MPKFDIEKFCSVIQNHRITYAYVVPPIVLLLSKHPLVDKYDLSSLRMLSCAAAPLTQELIETVYKRLKIPIRQGYGLSEASPITHIQVRPSMITTETHLLPCSQTQHSHGNYGTRPSAPSAVYSPTRPPNTCPPAAPKFPSATQASSGLKALMSSKATTITRKARTTR